MTNIPDTAATGPRHIRLAATTGIRDSAALKERLLPLLEWLSPSWWT